MPLFTKLTITPQNFVDIITNSKHTGPKMCKTVTLTLAKVPTQIRLFS